MIFLNRTFCGARNTLNYTATNVANINFITLQNGIFDEIHITKDTVFLDANTITSEWNYDTIMHALFNGNLHAGNVEYSADQITCIRIKRRKKNTYKWITLYEIPIETYKDFLFERFDNMCRSDTEYDYALIPVIGNIEGNANINSTISSFEGLFIMEKEQAYSTIIDVAIGNIQKNKPTSVITTLGSKYPYVVSNGEVGYYSGTVTGTFLAQDLETCNWKVKEGFAYRNQLMEFLENGKPKFLKTDDGRAWIISIINNASETENGHPEYIKTSFDFVETGNDESSSDLYNNNLIDVNIEGS